MKLTAWAFFVSVLLVGAHALTLGERQALVAFLTAFPALSNISNSDRFGSLSYPHEDIGGSWPNNFDTVCASNRAGYEIHGIHCSASNNIDGLVLTDGWGNMPVGNLGDFRGLVFVTNFTDRTVRGNVFQVAWLLSDILHLNWRHVILGQQQNSLQFNPYCGSIVSLDAYLTGFWNFSKCPNLTRLINRNINVIPNFEGINTGLTHVELYGAQIPVFQSLKNLSILPNLVSLRCLACTIDSSSPMSLTLSNKLEVLEMKYFSTNSIVIITDVVGKLRTLILQQKSLKITFLQVSAPNLKQLDIASFDIPINFYSNIPSLESLSLRDFSATVPWPDMGSIQNLTLLQSVHLESTNIPLSVWDNFFCSSALLSSLSSLSFIELGVTDTGSFVSTRLPSCLRASTTLKSLTISETGSSRQWDSSNFWLDLPSSLTSITADGTFSVAGLELNSNSVAKFKKLEILSLRRNSISSSIPEDFFYRLPALKSVNLAFNNLRGTIPWYGYDGVEKVDFSNNQLEYWPGFVGPTSSIKSWYVASNSLLVIPSDEVMDTLTSLEALDISFNPNLQGPPPSLLKGHRALRSYVAVGCGLEGSFPTPINAPKLERLSVGDNYICGDLPSFAVNHYLDTLSFSKNRFDSTIPEAWTSNLRFFSTLELDNNRLVGTFPSGLMGINSERVTSVSLNHNNITGLLWNIHDTPNLSVLKIDYTNLDVCARFQTIVLPLSYCNISRTANNPCNCESYWTNCPGRICPSPDSPPVFPPIARGCFQPQPRETNSSLPLPPPMADTPLECPVTPPSGFQCVDGVIIAIGNVEAPSIVFPPNAGSIIVIGNVTLDTSITFEGIGSTLAVDGCISIPGGVVIQIDPYAIENDKGTAKTLIQQNQGCPQSLAEIPVKVEKKGDSCKKPILGKEGTTSTTLVVAFTVDSGPCNTKWIILGSVLGSALFIVVLGTVVLSIISPKVRHFFRPFSKPRTAGNSEI